jgi:hypothetical protein
MVRLGSGTSGSNPLCSTGESKANPISWIVVDADAKKLAGRDADHRLRPATVELWLPQANEPPPENTGNIGCPFAVAPGGDPFAG